MKGSRFKSSLAGLGFFSSFLLASALDSRAEEALATVWEVSSPTATLFLAGSVHLLRQRDYPLPPAYAVAYDESEHLLFEVDLGATIDEEGRRRIAEAGRLPPGETLRDHVSEETYEMVQEYLALRGFKGVVFNLLTPGMLAVTIASFERMRKGALPSFGVDMNFYRRAIEDGKPVEGLETTEYQLALFSALSPGRQEAILRETLESLDESDDTAKEIISAWRKGKTGVLRKLLAEEVTKDEEVGELLLLKRNRAWLLRIVELLEGDRNVMVVVGAGHLVGDGSVVDLLRKRGYKVEQMRYRPESKGASP